MRALGRNERQNKNVKNRHAPKEKTFEILTKFRFLVKELTRRLVAEVEKQGGR